MVLVHIIFAVERDRRESPAPPTILLIFSYYLGGRLGPDMDDGASDSGSAAAAAAATAKLPVKVPGEMAQPVLGLGIFTVALVMIGTMDSYFGIPMLVLRFFSGGRAPITWADAYEPLHADTNFQMLLPG